MSSVFEGLEPKLVWEHFDEIRKTPRPSKKEEKIRAWVLSWAKDKGFAVREDEVGNIVIEVPATPGKEGAPMASLQGHLDMVCEKNDDVEFDFDTQPIDVFIDGDWLRAKGTTLGADNGIGVAMSMAAAIDPDVVHGPLELVFTIDEETGLTGAFAIKPGFVKGQYLLNLDSEDEGTIFVGCAGGGDTRIEMAYARETAPEGYVPYTVAVSGLLGGHSGLNIIDNRGNAVRLLAHVLRAIAAAGLDYRISSFKGGDKHNAIPREARAVVYAPADFEAASEDAMADTFKYFQSEFGALETKLQVSVDAGGEADGVAFSHKDGATILNLILALPHGVSTMSKELEGLVETSTNLARARTEGDVLEILMSTRSSIDDALTLFRERISTVCELAGATYEHGEAYPGWQPDMESPLLAICREVYEELEGKPVEVTAIHAGLECGIIGERSPGMKMISFGPTMNGVHSPDEHLSIQSTANVYRYLAAVLAKIAG